MLYKGRRVEYVRDAVKNDPYYDPEYDKVIVSYLDGEGYETVKESELDGWDAKERKGNITDLEKKQAQELDQARKNAEQNRAYSDSSVTPRPETAPAQKAVQVKNTSQLNTKK